MKVLVQLLILVLVAMPLNAMERELSEVLREKLLQNQSDTFNEVRLLEYKGRVVLIGYVYDATAINRAIRLVSSTEGVVEVINQLQYFPKKILYMFNYLKYENDIHATLSQSPGINYNNYCIAVNQQGVFIIGEAASEQEKQAVLTKIRAIMPNNRLHEYINIL